MKYDLEKNEKRIKEMEPRWFELVLFVIGLLGHSLALDLDLTNFAKVCSVFVIYPIVFTLIWLVDVVIYTIIKKKRSVKK